jgi:hypothetical protein
MPNQKVGCYEWITRLEFETQYALVMLLYDKLISRKSLELLGVPYHLANKLTKGNKIYTGSHYWGIKNVPVELQNFIAAFAAAMHEARRVDEDLGYKKEGSQPKGEGGHYP